MILVTGNKGYIGTVMTKMLKQASYHVLGLDNDWFMEGHFYSEFVQPDKQITKDIRNITTDDLDGVEAVIHLAALSNDPLGEINPDVTGQINTQATIGLAKLCKKKGIKKFIFASSCSIYGISENELPISEKGILNPKTAYAKAKVKAEEKLALLADTDFHPVLMRNATVYGSSPKLRLDLVVNNLVAHAYLTEKIRVMSDGSPWRPLIHVQDFCSAFIGALKAPPEKIHKQIFNVGVNQQNYQIKDIASAIQKTLPDAKIEISNKAEGDERTYRVDFSKIKDELGFKPRWSLIDGIEELVESFKKNQLVLNDFKSGKYFRIRTIQTHLEQKRMDKNLFWL